MANVDRPNGFSPVKYLNGAPYNGQMRKYYSPTDNLFVGDLVKLNGAGSADGYQAVSRAAAGDVVVGVVVGYDPDPSALDRKYHVASTSLAVHVADDPNLVLMCQEDAVGGALATASVGLNANAVVAAGDTSSGASNMELDTSSAAVTSTLQLSILGFVQSPDNEVATANAKVLVKVNRHQYANAATGV